MSSRHTTPHLSLFLSPDTGENLWDTTHAPPSLYRASPISSVWIALITYWTALRVALAHLITYETLFVSLVSAGSVLFYYLVEPQSEEPLVGRVSLTFMSFIIVFPITSNIGHAFVRREKALQGLASIKTYVMHIYVAHRDWAFESKRCKQYSGRNILNVTLPTFNETDNAPANSNEVVNNKDDWDALGGVVSQQHTEEVRFVMIKMIRAMRDFLNLPLVTRSRHLYTASGRRTRAIVTPVRQACLQDLYEQMQRLTLAVERMKEAGFPGNEAARINQYHSLLMKEWEMTRFIKGYRTPTGLRSFARLYILVHPLFAGPYYAWVAGAGRDGDVDGWPFQTSLAFAVALAVFTGVALQGLYNVEVGLEDPFDDSEGLDNVLVSKVFCEMERIVSMEWAPQVWNDTVMGGKSLLDAEFKQKLGTIPKDIPRPGLLEAKEAIKKDVNPFSCR